MALFFYTYKTMSTLEQKVKLQLLDAENEAKRLENEAKKLENEAKKLEIEAKKENTILRLTINEWVKAVDAGGGCAWTLAVLILLAVVVLNPEEAETLDQYIVGFGGCPPATTYVIEVASKLKESDTPGI